MRLKSTLAVVAVTALMLVLPACAAKGIRNQTRVSVLTLQQAIDEVDDAEHQVYAAGVYDQATHDRVGLVVLKIIRAGKSYQKAVAEWPANGTPVPAAIAQARKALEDALDELVAVVPALDSVRQPIYAAVNAVRVALSTPQAAASTAVPMQSQAPPGLLIAEVIIGLIGSGRSKVSTWLAALKAEGATDEQLAAVGADFDQREAAREAEHHVPHEPSAQG